MAPLSGPIGRNLFWVTFSVIVSFEEYRLNAVNQVKLIASSKCVTVAVVKGGAYISRWCRWWDTWSVRRTTPFQDYVVTVSPTLARPTFF